MKVISRRARPYTITLYNYVSTVSGVATYRRTVIKRVYLDTGYEQRLSQRGVQTTDKAQLIIDLRDVESTGNRTFLPQKEWEALADKTGHFTFRTENDFFVEGEVPDTIPTETKGSMLKKYQCYGITSVAVPMGGYIVQVMGK